MNKKKLLANLIINIMIIILEIVGLIQATNWIGIGMLIYYTQQSNILLLIASSIFVVYDIISLKKNKDIPQFVYTIKYMATCTTTQTFLVSLLLLAPQMAITDGFLEAYRFMFLGECVLYHHLLCPVLGIISVLIFDMGNKLTIKHTLYALGYTILYAVIYIPLNIFKVLEGPYFFLMVYNQPVYMSIIWCVVVLGIAYLICLLLKIITNKTKKN